MGPIIVKVHGKTHRAKQRVREHGPEFELTQKDWGLKKTDSNRVLLKCIRPHCACEKTGRWLGWFDERSEVKLDYPDATISDQTPSKDPSTENVSD